MHTEKENALENVLDKFCRNIFSLVNVYCKFIISEKFLFFSLAYITRSKIRWEFASHKTFINTLIFPCVIPIVLLEKHI